MGYYDDNEGDGCLGVVFALACVCGIGYVIFSDDGESKKEAPKKQNVTVYQDDIGQVVVNVDRQRVWTKLTDESGIVVDFNKKVMSDVSYDKKTKDTANYNTLSLDKAAKAGSKALIQHSRDYLDKALESKKSAPKAATAK